MARHRDKQKALELRRQGKSYSQIKAILGVGKGTLSAWLRDYPLSKERVQELRDWNEQRIERYRATCLRKKEARLAFTYAAQKKKIFPLTERDLFIAGLFLYWGEGSKTKVAEIQVTNTDPTVPKFFIYWTTRFLDVDKKKIYVHLHLYNDMDIDKEMQFWSRTLDVSRTQFNKPYIKKTTSTAINRGTFGHGTCTIGFCNARLSEDVLMGLKAVRDFFGAGSVTRQ